MKFKLMATSFVQLIDPIDSKWEKVIAYVYTDSIPMELLDWTEINPRKQNMKSEVAYTIKASLISSSNFHVLNRGICLNVNSYVYEEATGAIVIEVTDKEIHGVIDGGHSLRTIIESNNKPHDRFISFEIFNISSDDIYAIAVARNKTAQVDLLSLANLQNEFELLKELFSELPFAGRIKYRDNDEGCDIDVRTLISILMMFSPDVYPSDISFIIRYLEPEKALKRYLAMSHAERESVFTPLSPIIGDIFALWDQIEREAASRLPKGRRTTAFLNSRNAKMKKRKAEALFSQQPLDMWISREIMYPTIAAFSSLVLTQEGKSRWKRDPFELWDLLATSLMDSFVSEIQVPYMKSKTLWHNLYMTVKTHEDWTEKK